VNKDLKKFILYLIISIIVAFIVSFSYSAYQSYQYDKKLDEVKSAFNFGENNKKVENSKNKENNQNPEEEWQSQRLEALESLGYKKVDIRPFYKRMYDKLTGKKVYNYKSISNDTETVVVEIKDNKIIENFFNGDKPTTRQELFANNDFTSYDLKSYDLETMVVTTYKDVLNNDTYLNTKNGIIEYEDGKTVEFTHQNGAMNGPAVENLPNGDKIEFNFVNNKRVGEGEKFFKNGDRELFTYGENNQKNGTSIYYFANGDVEETTYVNDVLQGPAKYIYKDGVAEHYEYKDGKRVED